MSLPLSPSAAPENVGETSQYRAIDAASLARRYGLAVICVVLAIWIRRILDPVLGFQFNYATLFLAVLLSAWYGGLGPAVTSLLLGALAATHFLLPPRGFWWVEGLDQTIGMLLFLAVGAGIALIGGAMSAARQVAEASLRAEKSTSNRVARLREFVYQAPVAIAMFDRDMRYIAASHRWFEDFGLTGQTIENRSHYEIFPELPQHWKDIHRRCLAGAIERSDEELFVRSDGSQQWLRWEVRPWRVDFETIGGILIYSEDISARKNAELRQRASDEKYRMLVEHSLECIWITTGGRFAFANGRTAELVGDGDPAQLIGRRTLDFVHPEDRPAVVDRLRQVFELGKSAPLQEIRVLRANGSIALLEIQAVPLDFEGKPSALAVARDISERRRLETELAQSQKMEALGQLTGGVAHDFNNILTVITGTVEQFADSVGNEPATADLAKMIGEAAWRGADLTQRLLAFARRQPLRPVVTDVNALLLEATKLLQATLGERIEIQSMLRPDLHRALIDPSQLTSAILNLALNSRDAMPEQGKLIIETDHVFLDEHYAKANIEVVPGAYVMIAISDTGTGIAPSILQKVFEPFFTTKEVGRGTGLGLSMVYGFVKQSRGHVKIYSEEGQGTTVKLYLPEAKYDEATVPKKIQSPDEGGSERILVVEDDAMVRKYVVATLQELGYAVTSAENAADALELIDKGLAPDIMFTDVIMPGPMNGRALADEAIKIMPSLRIVFTSGYTENAIVHHGRLDSGVLLLSKPYRKSDLAKIIRRALS